MASAKSKASIKNEVAQRFKLHWNQQSAFDEQSGRPNSRIFSFEAPSFKPGCRRYVAVTVEDFWPFYRKFQNARHFYEVIKEDERCRPYFDLEFNRRDNPEVDGVECVRAFLRMCRRVFASFLDAPADEQRFMILDSTTDEKFSCHVIVHLPGGRLLPSNALMKSLAEVVAEEWKEETHFPLTNVHGEAVSMCDLSVYSKNRNFRLVKSSKCGKTATLKYADYCDFYGDEREPDEKDVFFDSLVVPENFHEGALIDGRHFDARMAAWNNEHGRAVPFASAAAPSILPFLRPCGPSSSTRLADNGELCRLNGPSPFARLETVLVDYNRQKCGNDRVAVRKHTLLFLPSFCRREVQFEFANCRFCHRIDREHKKQNVFWRVNLETFECTQRCFDWDCRGFVSAPVQIPLDVQEATRPLVDRIFLKYGIVPATRTEDGAVRPPAHKPQEAAALRRQAAGRDGEQSGNRSAFASSAAAPAPKRADRRSPKKPKWKAEVKDEPRSQVKTETRKRSIEVVDLVTPDQPDRKRPLALKQECKKEEADSSDSEVELAAPASPMDAKNFLNFLDNGPSPYHVVETSAKLLEENGFQKLNLAEEWNLEAGGRYFLTKGYTTICAFVVGGQYRFGNGYAIVGAHTDSPCLKVRPVSRLTREGFKQVTVDTYGGGVWRTWFDRNLSLAGLVTHRTADGEVKTTLVNLRHPILFVPNLAIHLVTDSNRQQPDLKAEEHLQPIFTLDRKPTDDAECKSEEQKKKDCESGCELENIVDFDLRAYNTEKALVGGLRNEFVFSARLDNLVGVYSALHGLIESAKDEASVQQDPVARIAFCFDHEEVGSESATGAQSAIVNQILERLYTSADEMSNGNVAAQGFSRAIHKSFVVSADQAHAAHPNYPEKHERNHRPRFDGSVVVKINANQRYATTPLSFTILDQMAKKADVKLTKFVVQNAAPCGSTIGPFISSKTGALTIDVGCAQLGMHSCRECGDLASVFSAIRLYKEIFSTYGVENKKYAIRDA
ncbi:Aspartyl aminopeptidase [Aphelenchoides fujianensis]|nr:Aspartyl aminopeptidase [Aphelenchoides fujianensis]